MEVKEDLQEIETSSSHATSRAVNLKYLGVSVLVIIVVALQVNSYNSSKFANHTPLRIHHNIIYIYIFNAHPAS